MRKKLIIILTFIGGFYYFLEFVLPEETGISSFVEDIGKVTIVITGFAFLLGVINLLRLHLGAISRKRPGWHNSLALIIAMFAMATVQFIKSSPTLRFEFNDYAYKLLFTYTRIPIDSTIFSLLAFYIASAAYRSFRIRNAEAALMMFTALLVMLGQLTIGQWFTSGLEGTTLQFLQFEAMRDWIMDVWNSGARRGILFGGIVGGLALSLRIWLSLERGSFFDRQL